MKRLHSDCSAFCFAAPPLEKASLFSLKTEFVRIASIARRYVDAVLIADESIVAVPFIYIKNDGSAILHEMHAPLHPAVRAWLEKTAAEWVALKGANADLEADLFDTSGARNEIVAAVECSDRPFPGFASYEQLFTEGERYANVSPFALGRSVTDFNPGFGYGLRTLAHAASSVAVADGSLTPLGQKLAPVLPIARARADVAVWLGLHDQPVLRALDAMRDAIREDGRMLISVRGELAADELREAGAEVVKMSRPGCDGLGHLEESLGVFAPKHRFVSVPAEANDTPQTPLAVAPRPLSILFGLRPSAKHIFGGDVVQVRETAQALRRRGHRVEISMEPSLAADGFDVVHLTNITVPPETLPQARSVAQFGGAVVMMPIFTDHADETAWGMNASATVFTVYDGPDDLDEKLRHLSDRTLRVGDKEPPPARMDMVPGYARDQKATLEFVDLCIANAHSEMNRLYRYLTCEVPYAVAPSCANPMTYGVHARERFVQRFGLEDFVLLGGRYEPRKNQLGFFQAMRNLDLPVVFIGNNYEPVFARVLRLNRPGRAAYIAHVPETELAGAFAAARVVAVPSWDEVVSLTALNAAISEASMVLSRNSYEHEYFANDAEYCDPGSIESIRAALQRAWDTHDQRAQRRGALAARVRDHYNWDRSAAITEEAYYRVLEHNPRGAARRARFAGVRA